MTGTVDGNVVAFTVDENGLSFSGMGTVNPDGSISRYQYTGFVVFLTDHGSISREKTVTLKLEGMASDKIQIA